MRNISFVLAVFVLLAGLPVVVWLDMRHLSEKDLHRQAEDFSKVVGLVREFYSRDVVSRIVANDGKAVFSHNFRDIPGGVPVPATFSLELANLLQQDTLNLHYRFLSDYPFKNRPERKLSDFDSHALSTFRAGGEQEIMRFSGDLLSRKIEMAIPVTMQQNCVACHNTHPQSRKTDWQVGDVRGVQVFSVAQPIAFDFSSYRNLLIYFVLLALTGGMFIRHQARQARTINESNLSLSKLNQFLEGLTSKLSVYLSPQIYKFIFSGDKNVSISTDRKKLTIFFSDIQGFTETKDNMQPEDLSNLLNEYLTEMSEIALKHGATIDKYIGDAILAFFGDPETRGATEDARACVRMAIEMQLRLVELNVKWRRQGIAKPFAARMGINTGYCNVGNFGSAKRMDYTIIGMEANLAARLEGYAEPGSIAISTETFGLVKDIVEAEAGAPVALKGIGREITPYIVKGLVDTQEKGGDVIAMSSKGLDLYIDVGAAAEGELDELIAKVIWLRAEQRAGLRGGDSALGASGPKSA